MASDNLKMELDNNLNQALSNNRIVFPDVFAYLMQKYMDKCKVRDVHAAARDISRLIVDYHVDLQILASAAGFDYQTLKKMDHSKKQAWLKISGVLKRLG